MLNSQNPGIEIWKCVFSSCYVLEELQHEVCWNDSSAPAAGTMWTCRSRMEIFQPFCSSLSDEPLWVWFHFILSTAYPALRGAVRSWFSPFSFRKPCLTAHLRLPASWITASSGERATQPWRIRGLFEINNLCLSLYHKLIAVLFVYLKTVFPLFI